MTKYVILIKDVCADSETRYVYNTNCKLSQLLVKTVNGTVTKYVYGRGLIGEETGGTFKTYHYDCRGSRVAITDMDGNVTDTFEYDTYGKLTARTGTSDAVFLYNGIDGVVTDPTGLYYMRARYYSPDMNRFINADIISGCIGKSPTLNRFAYANGNPIMNVDPLGLSAESENVSPNYTYAFYVTDSSLPYAGHAELYFWDGKNSWYATEFNVTGGENLLEQKAGAAVKTVSEEDMGKIRPMLEGRAYQQGDSGTIMAEDMTDKNYVVLTGNFDKSVEMAQNYDMGAYNLAFNNCSDYIDNLLNVADVDGIFAQALIKDSSLISVPSLTQVALRMASGADAAVNKVLDATVGKIIDKKIPTTLEVTEKINNMAHQVVDTSVNVVGDLVGAYVYLKNTDDRIIKHIYSKTPTVARNIGQKINSWFNKL